MDMNTQHPIAYLEELVNALSADLYKTKPLTKCFSNSLSWGWRTAQCSKNHTN